MSPLARRSLIACLFPKNSSIQRKSHVSISTNSQKQPVDTHTVSTVYEFLSGFSNTQLEKVVKYRPEFLSANLEKIIKPKIKIFQDLGFSSDEISDIVSKEPLVLHCSANNRLIPSLFVLKGLLGSILEVAKEFGDVYLYCSGSKFDDDILRVVRIVPMVFFVFEKKIKEITEVLVGAGKYNMTCIVNSPTSLLCSVEKRYWSRLKVLGVLEKRNLIRNWPCLGTMSMISDDKFFEKFVAPYLDDVGELEIAWIGVRGIKEMKLA
ncbi:hypothetical protein DH2020_007714 [Rehmannia glutinosa]|uniref:Uncharacterized protein n=1 Tax=Rehmannia glutinosa TaxID=99300 RepID=A0ABR0TYX2_REHGL